MTYRRFLFLIPLLIAALSGGTAHAETRVSLFDLPVPVADGMDSSSETHDFSIRDDGPFIHIQSGPGNDSTLSIYSFDDKPPYDPPTVLVPDTPSPGILGVFEDPGLPGDASAVILINESQSGEVEATVAGLAPPTYANVLGLPLDEAFEELADRGCEVSHISYNSSISPYYGTERFQQMDGTVVDRLVEQTGVSLHIYQIFVHCSDRANYVISLSATSDRDGLTVNEHFILEVSPGTRGGGQGFLATVDDPLPLAALPLGASALTHQAATVAVYPAQPAAGNSGFALPTIAWFGPDRNIADWLQIEGHDVGFSSELELCGSHFSDRLWLAYTGQDGNARLMRIVRPGTVEVFDLGPTTGLTAMDCDYWGNAVVAWATSDGDAINVRGYGPISDEPSSVQFAVDGQGSVPLTLSMNNNGQAAVMFSDDNGVFIQRVLVDNVVDIDLSFSGSWYSPWFQGEGFIWDISEIDGIPTLALFYFTYLPDGSGRQAWSVGSAEIINGVANIEAVIGEGGIFGSAYDPDDVTLDIWGEIEVRVLGCRRALMTIISPLFGEHAYPVQKFTNSPLNLDGLCATGSAALAEESAIQATGDTPVDGSYTGAWFTPERSFEGFIFDVTETNGQPTLVLYWFSYTTDGSGRPLWLIGSAPFDGNAASMGLLSGSGATFGPDFDPDSVVLIPFGNVTVTFNGCNSATVSYSVEGGESGSFNIERLAPLPPGVGGSCGS